MLPTLKNKSYFILLVFNLICLFGLMSEAVALPPNFQNETVLTGLNQPVNLATLPDGRMLVLLKGGEIRIFDPSTIPATSSTYMTITDIESGQERGLASLVLDPNFTTNNLFYAYYTHGSTARNRISQFIHEGNTASITSGIMIWEDNENWSSCCHYGGGLDFGPDGKLYLTTGEEFEGNQSQDLTRAGGKIIRINSDGTIPNDNPFIDGPGGNLDEIWAYGLRNPYRASWDILGNRFFIGDVGGNIQSTAREELNLGQAGGNYAWSELEDQGVTSDPTDIDPIYDYGHTTSTPNGGAITAGMAYRGNMFPSQYYGVYFFADYVLGFINYLELDVSNQVIGVTEFSNSVSNVVSLVEGPEGALYYTDIVGGQVRRIVYNSGNQPPTITSVDATPATGSSPLNVTFNVSATDPENDPLTYHWIFGDGTETDGGASISHTYLEGAYTAHVQVSDGEKTSLSDPIELQSGNPPVVQINTPVFGDLFQALDVINYSGSATDPDETLPESSYSWTINFIHNAHTHPELNGSIGSSGNIQINDSGHDYFDSTGFELILTVTDSAGLTGTDQIEIYPDKVNLNFSTSPAGQNIFLDGLLLTTPFVYDTMIGFRHIVSAPNSYCDLSNDTGYTFSSWSDGGARTHEVMVPSIDLDLVANYVATGPCVGLLITSGLTMQLESEGLAVNGSNVTGWNDQSGFGNDLVSGGNPQIVNATDLNDSAVVDFNGINDKLERVAGLSGLPTGNANRTMFLVAKYRGVGFGGFAYGKSTCNQAFGAIVDNSGNLTAQGWCGSNDFSSTTTGAGAGWLVQSIVLEAGVMKHYKDGVLLDTQNHTYNTTLSNMVLGGELQDNKFMDMQVAAVLIYDRALTDEEQQLTQEYLSNKYFADDVLNITTSNLTNGTINVAYSDFLSVTGGVTPYTWSIASEALPQGLSLDVTTGEISGIPLVTQTSNFTISVSDSVGSSVTSDAMLLTIGDGSGNSPATVLISDPVEGATIVGSDVLVSYTLAGTGYDHLHLTLDSNPHITITSLTGSYLLSNLTPGPHTITAQLVNAEHTALGNPESSFTVNITTSAVPNQPPTAVDDSTLVDVGASVDIPVLTNDSDTDGALDNTSVTIMTTPVNGTLVDNGNGLLTYTHDGTATTNDSFTYTVADDLGAVSNMATVTLVIGAQSLVTNGLVLQLEPDQGLNASSGSVQSWADQSGLGNDLQSAGDPQLVNAADLNNHLVVDFDGVGDKLERTLSLNGLPTGNTDRTVFMLAKYRGTGFGGFAYGTDACNRAFGAIVDNLGNLTAQGWCGSSDFSSTTTGTGAGWLIQTIVLEAGLMTHHKDGVLFDTQNHTYNTTLSKMVLGGELQDNKFMDMQVAAVLIYDRALSVGELQQVDAYLNNKYFLSAGGNQSPTTTDDSATVDAGASVDIPVLTNDSDTDGTLDNTTVTIMTAPVNGTLVDDGNGLLTYTHDDSATTSDSFTYTVADNLGAVSNIATVTLNIQSAGGNQSPTAVDDSTSVDEGASVAIPVLTNDSDVDGTLDNTSVTIMTAPVNGTLVDDGNGLLTYTHDDSATTSDSFTYTVADNVGAVSNIATVTLNIQSAGGNQSPTAVDDSTSVDVGASVAIPVLTNDSDTDGTLDNTSVTIMTAPVNGTLVDDGNGLLTYTHDGTATTNDSFTYTVADDLGAVSNMATVTLVIGAQSLVTNGLVLQLEPDQGLNASSGSVQSWADQSGLGNNLQSAGDPQLVNALDLNNHQVIDFDGVGDKLERIAGLSGLPTGNADRTMYMLAKYRGTGFGGFAYGKAKCNQAFGTIVDNLGNLTAQGWCGDFASTTAGTSAGWLIQSIVLETGIMKHYKDGVLLDTQNHTYNTTLSNMVLGGELQDNKFMDMQVAAVLVYDRALSVGELQQVDAYLNDKYFLGTGGNQSPTAVDDSATVDVGASVAIPVLTNDSDADGTLDNTTVTIMTMPVNGTLVDDGAGVLTYTHDGTATTTDSLTYTVADDLGAVSNVATVSLSIQSAGSNQPPTAVDDSATVDVGASVDIPALTNDSDTDGTLDNTTVSIVTAPVNGTLVDDGNGLLTYTHDGTATTTDSLTYTVADNLGAVSNAATVSVSIQSAGSNQLPTAADDSTTVDIGASVDIPVLTNDSDADGTVDNTTVTIMTSPANGALVDDGAGILTYTHDGTATTTDSFTYTVADDLGAVSNVATVSLLIGAQPLVTTGLVLHLESDQGLIANNGSVVSWTDQSTGHSSSHSNDLQSVGDPQLVNATDLNNHPVVDFDGVDDKLERTLTLYGLPAGNADRTVFMLAKYRSTGFGGFAYGRGQCNRAFGTIVDNVGNLTAHGWCGSNDFSSTSAGTGAGWLVQSIVLETGVMNHYKDGVLLDTQNHAYNTVLSKMVLGGELQDNNFMDMQVAAVLVYDRALSVGELQQVDKYLNDKYFLGSGGNSGSNQSPTAVDDSATVDVGASIDIPVLTNDSDPDGTVDNATVTIMTSPANGVLVDDGAGVLTYTHDGTATTTDSFSYTVADDLGAVSNVATVSLNIQSAGSNQPPTAVDDSATVDVGASVDIPVLTNDSDTDGTVDNTTVTIVTAPVNGTLVDDGNGLLTYTHDGTATTTDSLTYTVADDLGAVSNVATVSLSIQSAGSNQPPTAVDDSATVDVGASVDIPVLTNDSDTDGTLDNTTVTIVTAPVNGTLVDDGNGLLTYTHDGTTTTTDSFTYTVADNLGAISNTATVSLSIQSAGSNQSPTAVDDSATVDEGASVDIPVLANDSDTDGTLDTTTVTIMIAPVNGTLVNDGNGLLTYTHDGTTTTSDSFTYTVTDDLGAVSNTATVALVIGAQSLVTNGLVLQLEPDQGLNASGGSVQSWADQSGLGNDLQSAGDPQLVNAADLNNHQVVDFDGVGDKLERITGLSGLPTGNADRTVYMLAKYRGTGFGGFAYGTAACNRAFGAIVDNLGNLTAQGWCGSSDFSSATIGTGASWLVQSIVLKTGVMNHYKDGVLLDTQNHTYNTTLSNMVLGGELQDNNFMDMQVAAVLVYDRALSVGELQQVDTYLNEKYFLGSGGNSGNNQSPTAVDDSASVDVGASVDIPVLTNDSDPDGTVDNTTVTIVTAPVNGTLVDDGNGLLTYTHDGTATTTDSLTYTVADNLGAVSNVATVSLIIQSAGSNQPPTAVDDSATVDVGTLVDILVLTNDSDTDGTVDNTTVTIVTAPVNGTLVDDGNGLLTYTHDGTATTSDSFTYTIEDDQGAISNTATVTLTVTAGVGVAVSPQDCLDQNPSLNPQDCVIILFDGQSLGDTYPWFNSTGFSDPNQIFRIENNLLRITGTDVGALITNQTYKDYHMILEFKWGDQTFSPRQGKAKDAGLLLHSQGLEGSALTNWMPHIQSQIMEGGMGDFILLKGTDQDGNPLPMSITSSVEQVTCVFNTWNCRGGYRWDATGVQQVFNQKVDSVHLLNWDPSWQDVEGFRGNPNVENADGQWNQMVVIANGDLIQIFVNGIKVNEASNVVPAEGKIQLEVEWAEYFVRRWELWPVGSAPAPLNPVAN